MKPLPLLLALIGAAACAPITVNLPPVPTVPDPLRVPERPSPTPVAESFELDVDHDRVGATALGLQRKGLALVPFPPEVEVVRGDLLRALIEAGFRDVIDLQRADHVLAAHVSEDRGRSTGTVGRLPDLLGIVPVHRAEALLAVEALDLRSQQRRLPVRYTYDPAALAAYDAEVATYLERRPEVTGAMLESWRSYREEATAAIREAKAAVPPFQQQFRGADYELPEEQTVERVGRAIHSRIEAMPESLPSAEELAASAAARADENAVPIWTGRIAARVTDGSSGRNVSTV